MTKLLITGGAGYIGSTLSRLLLNSGYKVRVLDLLLFGGESILDLLNDKNFEFIKGDVRNDEDRIKSVDGIDFVVHLAAIVGDPACSKQPDIAKETNLEASKLLYQAANNAGCKRFIFASTCSNYGKMADSDIFIDENSPLNPISLYAETKVGVELFLLSQKKENICKPICLRFSTAYGLSSRMRFDLTVNEFTKYLSLGKELLIFGEQFWRPYCHVVDLARSIMFVMNTPVEKIEFEVYNVGDTNENYTKKMIVEEIIKIISDSKIKYVHKDEDPRDYRVSFAKIKSMLGFTVIKTLPDGISQIYKAISDGFIKNPDDIKYKNTF